jgi:hypothetical protein
VELVNRLDGTVFEQLENLYLCDARRDVAVVLLRLAGAGRAVACRREFGVGALHGPENSLDRVGQRHAARARADEQRHDAKRKLGGIVL